MPPGGPGKPRPGGAGTPPAPLPPPQPPPPPPVDIAPIQAAITALQEAQCATCIPTPIPEGTNVLGTSGGGVTWIATEEC